MNSCHGHGNKQILSRHDGTCKVRTLTLSADREILIRTHTNRNLVPSVTCLLKKNATYHPWNFARVKADRLRFKAFTKIETYTIKKPLSLPIDSTKGPGGRSITFKKGDNWEFLFYQGEGNFRIRVKGREVDAEMDLIEHSTGGPPAGARHRVDEWVRLTCANGAKGWIFLPDVTGKPGFEGAHIVGYGKAVDRDVPSPDGKEN